MHLKPYTKMVSGTTAAITDRRILTRKGKTHLVINARETGPIAVRRDGRARAKILRVGASALGSEKEKGRRDNEDL